MNGSAGSNGSGANPGMDSDLGLGPGTSIRYLGHAGFVVAHAGVRLLSMRLSLHRAPDVFDLTLMSLLRYGNHTAQTMQLVRERENTETIDRDGLRMQRFCPHAGEDLTFATICDGVIECPRHHWKWDAASGKCLDGGTIDLRVAPLPVAELAKGAAQKP